MTKTAIFVEGQTELIFMREYLLKIFDYQDIWIECYTLFNDGNHTPTEYAFPNSNAKSYFQIINVGNDNAVLTRVLRREQFLWNSGFDKIFAIRDMYSKDYRQLVQNATINQEINERFISGTQESISKNAQKPNLIYFQFAIMEVESWILGFKGSFIHLHSLLTTDYIKSQLNIDLENDDPEINYFHPASVMKGIYQLAGLEYNKSKSDAYAILSRISKDDFLNLHTSDKCQSFSNVHESIYTK